MKTRIYAAPAVKGLNLRDDLDYNRDPGYRLQSLISAEAGSL